MKEQEKVLKGQERLKKQDNKKLQKELKEQEKVLKGQERLQQGQVKQARAQKAMLKKQLKEQVQKFKEQQNFKKKHLKLQLQVMKELKGKDPRYKIEQQLLKEAMEQNKKLRPKFLEEQKRRKNARVLKKKVTLNEMLNARMLEEMYLRNRADKESFNRKATQGERMIKQHLAKKVENQNANILLKQLNKIWKEDTPPKNEYDSLEASTPNAEGPKKTKKKKKKHPNYFRAGESPTDYEKEMMKVDEQMEMWYNVYGHNLKQKKGVKFVNKEIKLSPPKLTEAQKKYKNRQQAVKTGLVKEDVLKELRVMNFKPIAKPRVKPKPLHNVHYRKFKALKELEQLQDYRGKPKYLKVLKELKAIGYKPQPRAKGASKGYKKTPVRVKDDALRELKAIGYKPQPTAKVIVMKQKSGSKSSGSDSNSGSSGGGIKMKMHIGGQEKNIAKKGQRKFEKEWVDRSDSKNGSLPALSNWMLSPKKKSPPKIKPVPKKLGGKKFKPKAAPRQRKQKEENKKPYKVDPKTGLLVKTGYVNRKVGVQLAPEEIYKMARKRKICPFCKRKLTFIPDTGAEKITHGLWVCKNQYCEKSGFFIEGDAMYNNQ